MGCDESASQFTVHGLSVAPAGGAGVAHRRRPCREVALEEEVRRLAHFQPCHELRLVPKHLHLRFANARG